MTNILQFGTGHIQIVEVRIQERSPAAGETLVVTGNGQELNTIRALTGR